MTTLARPRIHILSEYGSDSRPHTPSCLRFIRPFTYPTIVNQVEASFGWDYQGQPADLVLLERLWRPDVTLPVVEQLVERIHQAGARFIYSLDDNFFDLALENKGWPPPGLLPIIEYCLRQAHGVLVTTPALKERLEQYNSNILILPNALDERLLVRRIPPPLSLSGRGAGGEGSLSLSGQSPWGEGSVTIGYMGTPTHDEDLQLVLPALHRVCHRHAGNVELQLIGAVRSVETKKLLSNLPVRQIPLDPRETEYPLFMLWFTANTQWDIAISPLRDTPFNRCKSDIKFLDYAAIGAAGVFSKIPAYTTTVQHQQNGWLAENTPEAWEKALETLIANPELRWHLASNANNYLYAARTLAQRATDWAAAVNRMLLP
jgi:processive 1,2-diacylglycerol beta-glucosyltransferase